jgi:hypothetical protein
LDRQLIKELREFVLSGMQVFRWLLIGLHQDSGNLLDVFNQWRKWRIRNKEPMPDDNVRVYYTQPTFHREFLEFVRSHYLTISSRARVAISTLADYEAAFAPGAAESPAQTAPEGRRVDKGGLISLDSRASVAPGIYVTQLDADYQVIVELLRRKSPITSVPIRQVTLVTHENQQHRTEILQLSQASAQLLPLCKDGKTVREIARELPASGLQVPGVPDEKVCLFGIEVLRRQGLVDLEAPADAPSVSEKALSAV